jgi:hypothetical protein
MNNWKEDYLKLFFPQDGKEPQIEKAYGLKYENLPKAVFKYMKFDKDDYSIQHLKYNTVWLSNPTEFNDPFDSVININFLKIFHDSSIGKFLETAEAKHNVPRALIEEAKKNENPRNYLTEYILKTKGFNDELLRRYQKFDNDMRLSQANEARWNLVDDLRSSIRVGSFSENYDHMLMWTHYSENHKGFCIKYDLSTSSEKDLNLRFLYPVYYSDDLTDFTREFKLYEEIGKFDALWAIKGAMSKGRNWSYESEWRLIISNLNSRERLHKFLPIKAVYVGAKIDEKNMENILAIAKPMKINVYKMYLSENRFGLEFDKIS